MNSGNASQFEYLGRWVDKKHFRAFVYSGEKQKLANSYEEFMKLIGSGEWKVNKSKRKLSEKKLIETELSEISDETTAS